AVDELEHEVTDVVDFLESVYPRHIGMIQGREQPRFALEARQPLGILGKISRQRLDRHIAAEPGVARAVNLAHTPRTKRSNDLERAEPGPRSEVHLLASP